MLKTRPVTINDLTEIKRLHDAYYSELDFPEFSRLLNSFLVEDENGDIVTAGGIEPMAEGLLVSNKSMNRIKLGKALVIAQGAFLVTCERFGFKWLHAFTKNPDFVRHLLQHGFETRNGDQVLRMGIQNGR